MPIFDHDGNEYNDHTDFVLDNPVPKSEGPLQITVTPKQPDPPITGDNEQVQNAAEAAASRLKASVKPLGGRTEGSATTALPQAVQHTAESLKQMVEFPRQYMDFMTEMSKKPELTEEDQFKINQMQDQATKWGPSTALNVGIGGLSTGVERKAGEEVLGVFAGKRALTADKDKLAIAKTAEFLGEHPDDIWQKTGWFKGIDNQWKHEIIDSGSKIKTNYLIKTPIKEPAKSSSTYWQEVATSTKDHTLSLPKDGILLMDILDHPKLYEAYPWSRGIIVKEETRAGVGGSMGNGVMTLAKSELQNPERTHQVLLHEIQHAIQSEEGFAKGAAWANKSEIVTGFEEDINRAFNRAVAIKEKIGRNGSPTAAEKAELDKIYQILEKGSQLVDAGARESWKNYWRSAGEVEARQVERRLTNPKAAQDVPSEDQLVFNKPQTFNPYGDNLLGASEEAKKLAKELNLPYRAEAGKNPRSDLKIARERPEALDNIVTEWARGNSTAKEVQSEFKKHGWTVDLRRGGYDVEAFDPDGKAHYITP